MKNTALWKVLAVASAAVLATACVITTSDDDDDGPDDLPTGGTGTTAGSGGAGDEGGAGDRDGEAGSDAGSGGAVSSGGTAGDGGSQPTAGAAGTQIEGECELAMDATCEACLDERFSNDDGTGIWDECDGEYPCCEESARYVRCLKVAYIEDPGVVGDEYAGDAEQYCADMVVAGLYEGDSTAIVSDEFNTLAAYALGSTVDDNCFVECVFGDE